MFKIAHLLEFTNLFEFANFCLNFVNLPKITNFCLNSQSYFTNANSKIFINLA